MYILLFLLFIFIDKYYFQTSNILYHTLSLAIITNPFGYRIIESYPPLNDSVCANKYYYYGPTDKIYEIDTITKIVIISIIVIYTIMMIITILYLIKYKENNIYKAIGNNYIFLFSIINFLTTLIPILYIIQPLNEAICHIRYYMICFCVLIFYSLLYNRAILIAKVTKNRTYFRVRYSTLKQILNIISPMLLFVVVALMFRCFTSVEVERSLDHSSLFTNVYIEYCKGNKYENGINISLLYLYILYGFKLAWDIKYINNGYYFSAIFSINFVVIISGMILIPTFSILTSMEKEKGLVWVWCVFFFSAAAWLCIFGRIYII